MSSSKRTLPDEEAIKKKSNMRIAASTSFTEAEVQGLDTLLSMLRRGGDASLVARSPAMQNVHRKVLSMKEALERQRGRRALAAGTVTQTTGTTAGPDLVVDFASIFPNPPAAILTDEELEAVVAAPVIELADGVRERILDKLEDEMSQKSPHPFIGSNSPAVRAIVKASKPKPEHER